MKCYFSLGHQLQLSAGGQGTVNEGVGVAGIQMHQFQLGAAGNNQQKVGTKDTYLCL